MRTSIASPKSHSSRCDTISTMHSAGPPPRVRCILVAQSTRQPLDRRCLEKLRETYPQASFLNLQGTLCEGMRGLTEPTFGPNRHYWHRWNQVLPEWLGSCGVASDYSQQLSQARLPQRCRVDVDVCGGRIVDGLGRIGWSDSGLVPTARNTSSSQCRCRVVGRLCRRPDVQPWLARTDRRVRQRRTVAATCLDCERAAARRTASSDPRRNRRCGQQTTSHQLPGCDVGQWFQYGGQRSWQPFRAA